MHCVPSPSCVLKDLARMSEVSGAMSRGQSGFTGAPALPAAHRGLAEGAKSQAAAMEHAPAQGGGLAALSQQHDRWPLFCM